MSNACSFFVCFLLILLQYTNDHTQNVLKKPLMSRKHSFFSPCSLSVSFLQCVLHRSEQFFCFVHLNQRPLEILTHSREWRHSPSPSTLHHFTMATAQVQDEGKKPEKSHSVKQELLTSVRSVAGPEVRSGSCIAWVSFEL